MVGTPGIFQLLHSGFPSSSCKSRNAGRFSKPGKASDEGSERWILVGHQGIGASAVVGPDVMDRARECDDGAVVRKRKAGLRFLLSQLQNPSRAR